jgi:hypothetical protein
VKILTRGGKELILDRDFTFGKEGRIFFGAENYQQLKKVFEEIQKRDDDTISLKQTVTAEAR